MTITVTVPDQLSEKAAAQGLSIEAYVEAIAAQAVQLDMKAPAEEDDRQQAIDGLLAFRRRHHLTLDRDREVGLRAWIHQGHRR